ncbi:MAG: YebC/PmpR family DNA-binding transcriptional regulator [Anaerolineae bacterium]|nr:YebC/PmpR family DNA-binding transcriptional regulator [Anaerolineae bacterium]MDQ7035187.1 YebC/PmpR family DNA-binding transcriptional regulator [Anaerolineae bacterium]
MSGHSKWSTIKRKKGAEDAKRAKIFTRLARDVMVAARDGGGDPEMNPKLKLAVQKAKSANMPNDNVDRAIKRGTGELDGGTVEEYTYEGYGVAGIAFMIEVITDNKNRSLAEVKNVFNKNNGTFAQNGAVAYQFDQKGYITLKQEEGQEIDIDEVFMVAAEADAEDVVDEDGIITVYTPRDQFGAVEQALLEGGYKTDDAELRWFPQIELDVALKAGVQNMRIMEKLEELDDVQSVASNLNITDELVQAFSEKV